jgi:hypothetical protein
MKRKLDGFYFKYQIKWDESSLNKNVKYDGKKSLFIIYITINEDFLVKNRQAIKGQFI